MYKKNPLTALSYNDWNPPQKKGLPINPHPCNDWYYEFAKSKTILFGSAGVVSIMNVLLRMVLGAMSHLEKKHTETERLESAVSKMWIVTYINTAIILLLVGTKYDKLFSTTDEQGEKLGWMPILSGTHRDANRLWYETIGSGIIITCFIMALTPCGNLIFLGVG